MPVVQASAGTSGFVLTETEQEYLSSLSGRPVTFAYSYESIIDGDSPGLRAGMLSPFFGVLQNTLGIDVEVVKLDWSSAFAQIEAGTVDFYGLITITESRRDKYVTIDPIYCSDTQIVSRVADPVSSPVNLANEKIGLLEGSIIGRSLETYIAPQGSVVYYPTFEDMIVGLENSEIECFATVDNAEIEILRHEEIQYELSIDNSYANQGFISGNEEMRPLAAIINRYIAHDTGLSDKISEAKRKYIIEKEQERLAGDIAYLRDNYDVITSIHSGGAYPVCYTENGVTKGIQIEINEVFASLTGLEIKMLPKDSYPGDLSQTLEAIKAGDCLMLGASHYNLDIAKDPDFVYSRQIWTDTIRTYSIQDIQGELKDLRVGTTRLSMSYANWSTLLGREPIQYTSRPDLVQALKNKEIDVAFLGEMSFNYINMIQRDYSLREFGNISAKARVHTVYSTKTPELNRLYDSAIHLYRALYPGKTGEWLAKSERYKSDYIRIRESQETMMVVVAVIFAVMLLAMLYLLKRYTVYDKQISQMIRKQQNFDLAWGNLRTRVFTSKGDHPFFREWGLKFSGPTCSMDELTEAFGWDLSLDYKQDMEDMTRDHISFIVSDKTIISPLDGEPRHYRRYLHKLNDYEFMSCLRDITEEVLRRNELEQIATTDFLSNLLTRRAMNDKITARCDELRTHGGQSFLIMFDIDDFKQVNDFYGHDVGDMVLVSVADVIQNTEGCRNSTARWGGEEFLILLDCANISEAEARTTSIITNVAKRKVTFGNKSISVTVSAGLVQLDPHHEYTRSVTRADKALYDAKHSGKNCLRTF